VRRARIALLVVGSVVGCGDDGPTEVDGLRVVDGAPEITVEADDFAFDPAEIDLTAGDPANIVLVSVGGGHNLGVIGADFLLPIVDEGEQTRGALTIAEPGTYEMVCTVPGHREQGMHGTVVVEVAA
jgi:cytochrome c oxidase subunit II